MMHELLTPEAMGRADRLTIAAGTPGIVLMERAGRAVADAVAFGHPLGSRVLVLAGPGNNGGDGFIAARVLRERGYHVAVLLLGDVQALKGDAAQAADRWGGDIGRADGELGPALGRASVVVDALYGAGLARDLDGVAADCVTRINASGLPVVAVDLPSGIDGLTGAVRGVAIRATTSVTFFRRKPGHLLLPGRIHCGPVIVADIGISPSVLREIGVETFANRPALWLEALPVPALTDHKYARGHVLSVSGGMLTTGAARLAAMAALRAGAGLVTLASPPDALMVNAAHLTAIMLRRIADAEDLGDILTDARFNACLIGPGAGVGAATIGLVEKMLTGRRGVVLDADALTSFAGNPEALFERVRVHSGPVVLTPHEGEFSRLFPDLAQAGGLPKPERARQAARRSGAVIVLKGADTVIASPDGKAAINDNAPADLATAGSGDTLAGIIAGLIARGLAGFEAAAAGVWMHGETGRLAGAGLIAEDLAGQMPRVLADLYRLKTYPRDVTRDEDEDVVMGGSD